jgi:hypothetical protein
MPRFHEGVFGPMIETDSIVAPNGLLWIVFKTSLCTSESCVAHAVDVV